MRKSVFRFKKFDCAHGSGSMKIGVDAVLLGAWVDVCAAKRIIDVGTGCGVIALMCAQRSPYSLITALDIDPASVEEAAGNFRLSPWSERLSAVCADFMSISEGEFDHIVSNPPFFDSGVYNPDTPRMVARHQSVLSPLSLLASGRKLLSVNGRISMIVPRARFDEILCVARSCGLGLSRAMFVRGHKDAPVKRVLMEFCVSDANEVADSDIKVLTLENAPGVPTVEHLELCHDFYLKF